MADNLTIKLPGGSLAAIATHDRDGAHHQVTDLGGIYATASPTGAATGAAVDISKLLGLKRFSLQVTGVGGTPTAWEVYLEGGNTESGVFSEFLSHKSADGDGLGKTKWGKDVGPFLFVRWRVEAVSLNGATGLALVWAGGQ